MKYIILVILLLAVLTARAQVDSMSVLSAERAKESVDSAWRNVPRDSSAMQVRMPTSKRLAEAMNDGDYTYDRTAKPHDITWLQMIEYWLQAHLFNLSVSKTGSVLGNIILYSAIVALIVLAGVWLSNSSMRGIFYGSRKKLDITFSEDEVEISELDLQKLIDDNISSKNYRRAVRYLFLRELKRLSDNKVIEWNAAKTNRIYLLEIKDQTVRSKFKHVSWLFENIWYGDFTTDEATFLIARNSFEEFAKSLPTKQLSAIGAAP
jgi:hypothetical protein